jgi:hypothetical protein
VAGDGVADRAVRTGERLYRDALRALDRGDGTYQVLCANCNWIKRAEQGEHTAAGARGW